MSDIEQKTKNILTIVLKLNSDTSVQNATMESISSWDSMALLSIVTAIENEFDIFIDAAEAEHLVSYEKIIDFLNNHPEIP